MTPFSAGLPLGDVSVGSTFSGLPLTKLWTVSARRTSFFQQKRLFPTRPIVFPTRRLRCPLTCILLTGAEVALTWAGPSRGATGEISSWFWEASQPFLFFLFFPGTVLFGLFLSFCIYFLFLFFIIFHFFTFILFLFFHSQNA